MIEQSTLTALSMQLIETENALRHIAVDANVSMTHVQQIEGHIRDIRSLTNSLWATEVTAQDYKFGDLGIHAYTGDGHIEFEFPYDMITKTTMFRLFSKKLSALPSLVTVTSAWHFVMKQLLDCFQMFPFSTPLPVAHIHIAVLCPDKRVRDPDHFWFRPILDSLVYHRLLIDDNSGCTNVSFEYAARPTSPAVIVQVTPGDKYAPASNERTLVGTI